MLSVHTKSWMLLNNSVNFLKSTMKLDYKNSIITTNRAETDSNKSLRSLQITDIYDKQIIQSEMISTKFDLILTVFRNWILYVDNFIPRWVFPHRHRSNPTSLRTMPRRTRLWNRIGYRKRFGRFLKRITKCLSVFGFYQTTIGEIKQNTSIG